PLLDPTLRSRDQLSNIGRGRMAQVDHDVGVHVRDLGVADAKALHSQLIDEPSCPDAIDLLEDRARAGMPLEPWVLAAAPAEVFLHDALQDIRISFRQLERS